MRKVALVQARMDSARLPGKVLMSLAGKPMALHVVERLQTSKQLDHIVVATAEHPSNDPLVEICRENGVDVFRGSLSDVLLRLTEAGRRAGADIVVRVTCAVLDFYLLFRFARPATAARQHPKDSGLGDVFAY